MTLDVEVDKSFKSFVPFSQVQDDLPLKLLVSGPYAHQKAIIEAMDQMVKDIDAMEKPEDTSVPSKSLSGKRLASPPKSHNQGYLALRRGRF